MREQVLGSVILSSIGPEKRKKFRNWGGKLVCLNSEFLFQCPRRIAGDVMLMSPLRTVAQVVDDLSLWISNPALETGSPYDFNFHCLWKWEISGSHSRAVHKKDWDLKACSSISSINSSVPGSLETTIFIVYKICLWRIPLHTHVTHQQLEIKLEGKNVYPSNMVSHIIIQAQ